MQIAIVTVSDRASRGQYEDLSGPAIEEWLNEVVTSPYEIVKRIIPDGVASVSNTLIALCDETQVDLILTTGGTGPAPRDETPEAMREVLVKELPGFVTKPGEGEATHRRPTGRDQMSRTSTSRKGAYCCAPKMSASPGLPLGRRRRMVNLIA